MQLQSETETIGMEKSLRRYLIDRYGFVGDYIHLYQQQREQLQKRYQEKDEIIQQLTAERENLQRKISNVELNGKR